MYQLLKPVVVAIVLAGVLLAEEPRHWAYQPVNRPELPTIENLRWARNSIDYFVLDKLQSKGLTPSEKANPVTLLRRVSLDLTGILPTPAEVAEYLADDPQHRYEQAVERLLASPRYGERWARPWLDLCHYADTDGYLTDQLRPVAWRYRDWLISALNSNLSFRDFTIQQLAGDQLQDATMKQRLATGFLRQTLSNREGGAEPEEFRVKQVIDRTEMVGTIWLGLTVGCARCHDHKYDELSQNEFFSLYACLNNVDEVNVDAPLPAQVAAWTKVSGEYTAKRDAILAERTKSIAGLQKRWEAKCKEAWKSPGKDHVWDRQWELLGLIWGGGLGEGQLEGQEIAKLPWPKRTPRQKYDLLMYFLRHGSIVDPAEFKKLKCNELLSDLQKLRSSYPQVTRAPIVQTALTHRPTFVHERGEFRDQGDKVAPNTPAILPPWKQKGQARLSMARWLVADNNPLTARVTVNRWWEQFFGEGLVATTEDFGVRGTPPSHPRLLDWLASELMSSGWDAKRLHRAIVLSATYMQSSARRNDVEKLDPENRLLARQSSLRLSAEAIRDNGLFVSGLLADWIGGPSVRPPQPPRVTEEGFGNHDWKVSEGGDRYRRSLYTFMIRTTPFAQSILFDAPNPNEICTRRLRSNTPIQALTLLNDPMFFEYAKALGRRLQAAPVSSNRDRIRYGFQLCVTRKPTETEVDRLVALFDDEIADGVNESDTWTLVASVLLNLHEFITRD